MIRGAKMLNSISELDNLLDNNNEIIIYGAGKVAMTIIKYLSNKNVRKPKAILVSTNENNPSHLFGIPIFQLSDCMNMNKNIAVLCCVMERLHNEIREELANTEFQNIEYISDSLFHELEYSIGDLDIENHFKLKQLLNEEDVNRQRMLKFVPKPCLDYVIFNILDHCNLRCKGCDHFACIADEYTVPYETIHKDVVRMAEIFDHKYISQIAVMGGEPLLHPDILRILKDVRDNFPYAIIRLTTNAILLPQQNELFWKTCSEENITIVVTKYPLKINHQALEDKAKSYNVKYKYFEGTGNHIVKYSFKKNIDLSGEGKPVENFSKCTISSTVSFVMEGKLYECPFSCQSYRIFNKKFEKDLQQVEEDYLDIYKVKDKQEIFEFNAKPKNYCRYCTKGLTDFQPWSRSNGEISEWVDE